MTSDFVTDADALIRTFEPVVAPRTSFTIQVFSRAVSPRMKNSLIHFSRLHFTKLVKCSCQFGGHTNDTPRYILVCIVFILIWKKKNAKYFVSRCDSIRKRNELFAVAQNLREKRRQQQLYGRRTRISTAMADKRKCRYTSRQTNQWRRRRGRNPSTDSMRFWTCHEDEPLTANEMNSRRRRRKKKTKSKPICSHSKFDLCTVRRSHVYPPPVGSIWWNFLPFCLFYDDCYDGWLLLLHRICLYLHLWLVLSHSFTFISGTFCAHNLIGAVVEAVVVVDSLFCIRTIFRFINESPFIAFAIRAQPNRCKIIRNEAIPRQATIRYSVFLQRHNAIRKHIGQTYIDFGLSRGNCNWNIAK